MRLDNDAGDAEVAICTGENTGQRLGVRADESYKNDVDLTLEGRRRGLTESSKRAVAIGDLDKLKFKPDGLLSQYIQNDSPGKEKESKRLPTVRVASTASSPFTARRACP
jgi:hypothetical protein